MYIMSQVLIKLELSLLISGRVTIAKSGSSLHKKCSNSSPDLGCIFLLTRQKKSGVPVRLRQTLTLPQKWGQEHFAYQVIPHTC